MELLRDRNGDMLLCLRLTPGLFFLASVLFGLASCARWVLR